MNQRSSNFRATRQNFDQRWSNLIMTTITSRTHRFLFRSLIFRSSHLFRNHRICLNQMINSLSRSIKNQNRKFLRIHLNVIAIVLENISHRQHIWVSCSIRLMILISLSLSSSLRSRYSLSLSSLSSIRSYTSFFFQFAAFRQKEINDLIEKNVFRSMSKNDVSFDVRIFNFRFVDEIKHFDIDKAFEKSRFVMQTFNDQNKNLILIQSSTI
jgi:hypothetical protein